MIKRYIWQHYRGCELIQEGEVVSNSVSGARWMTTRASDTANWEKGWNARPDGSIKYLRGGKRHYPLVANNSEFIVCFLPEQRDSMLQSLKPSDNLLPRTYHARINAEPTDYMKAKMRWVILYQSKGMTDAEIARKVGYKNPISVSMLRQSKWFQKEAKRVASKLPQPVGLKLKRFCETDYARLRQLHAQGLTHKQIAAQMQDWNEHTVYRKIRELGLRPPKKSHLSETEKATIIRMREAGELQRVIAKAICRPTQTVSAFCVKHFGVSKYQPTKGELLDREMENIQDNVIQDGDTLIIDGKKITNNTLYINGQKVQKVGSS